MKLSSNTTMVLKNFATINQNLVIKEGSELLTMSSMKNIVAINRGRKLSKRDCNI